MTGDRSNAAPAATLGADCRLKTQRQFRYVYKRGSRAAGHWMTVVGVVQRGDNRPGDLRARVGLSVSKQHGGAVRRNKIKRLLREAFRHERHRLPPGLDLVLIPQRRTEHYPLAAMRSELVVLVDRVVRGAAGTRNRRRRGSQDPKGTKAKDPKKPKGPPQ